MGRSGSLQQAGSHWPIRVAALVLFVLAPFAGPVAAGAASTLTVNSTADTAGACAPAACTVRQAITTANGSPGGDTIAFNIPGTAPYTIEFSHENPLPAITETVVIDGTTQPGYSGTPVVQLRGVPLGENTQGIRVTADGSTLLGLDVAADSTAVIVTGSDTTVGRPGAGNVLSACDAKSGTGLQMNGDRNVVEANRLLGCDAGAAVSGSNNRVGGLTAGSANVITGSSRGLSVTGSLNLAQGNSVRGRTAIAVNGSDNRVGGAVAAASNALKASRVGVQLTGDRNAMEGNAFTGSGLGPGVIISGNGNSVRSNSLQNTFIGVVVLSGTGNTVLANVIPQGEGIRLGNFGAQGGNFDPGDVDTGPNNLQNSPLLTVAGRSGSATTVGGVLDSEPNKTYTLEFFSSPFKGEPCGGSFAFSFRGGAALIVGQSTATTDSNGHAAFNATLPVGAPGGDWVTGTATDPAGNTSEFARCIRVNRPPDCSAVAPTPDVIAADGVRLVLVSLGGAADPDGDTVALTVTGVSQDEQLTGGEDKTSPDAFIGAAAQTATNEVYVRAERRNSGDGRVYRISFSGADGNGGSCSGTVKVAVPRKSGQPAVDSAPPAYNSLAP